MLYSPICEKDLIVRNTQNYTGLYLIIRVVNVTNCDHLLLPYWGTHLRGVSLHWRRDLPRTWVWTEQNSEIFFIITSFNYMRYVWIILWINKINCEDTRTSGVFRTLSNTYDESFCKKSERFLPGILPSIFTKSCIIDVSKGSECDPVILSKWNEWEIQLMRT